MLPPLQRWKWRASRLSRLPRSHCCCWQVAAMESCPRRPQSQVLTSRLLEGREAHRLTSHLQAQERRQAEARQHRGEEHTRHGNTKDQERYLTSLRRKSNKQRTTDTPGHSNSRTTEKTRLLRPFEAAQEHAPGRGDQSGDPIPPSRNVPHRSRADCQGLLFMESDTLSMRGGQADQVT